MLVSVAARCGLFALRIETIVPWTSVEGVVCLPLIVTQGENTNGLFYRVFGDAVRSFPAPFVWPWRPDPCRRIPGSPNLYNLQQWITWLGFR